MYKALIVDDEKMIRMGMKKVIPWDELGIGEVYTAASAAEALEVLDTNRPQIMITDIPNERNDRTGTDRESQGYHSGIESNRFLQDMIIFEYARQSLRLQVRTFF